jgi:hypothetical protein
MSIESVPATTIESVDLDATYGELLEPPYFDDLEVNVSPRSLQVLNSETAEWLKAFMRARRRD